jgi:hypothetical protein
MTAVTSARPGPPPPDERPLPGPSGPRTPYPVNAPPDPVGPGSAPDYIPATPDTPPGRV